MDLTRPIRFAGSIVSAKKEFLARHRLQWYPSWSCGMQGDAHSPSSCRRRQSEQDPVNTPEDMRQDCQP